ncbi:MAG: zinc-binding alcohol dehydrogenase family protein [Defluviitaleaceae bacterium]|nr:zinc-binding alcohol dehydrogenase family protein [Defluviitaleaceae bacterium]
MKIKAIGFTQGNISIDDENSLQNVEIDMPMAKDKDILVKVNAVGLNPVDTKIRRNSKEKTESPRILGFDAVGIVENIGENVTKFKKGDRVYYSGALAYSGSNAQYQLMHEGLVSIAPEILSDNCVAGVPLTGITAYECLFEKMHIPFEKNSAKGKTILFINGAGGVGSIGIQLAKWAGLTVIATSSRQETTDWCKKMGADHTVDYKKNIVEQVRELGFENVDYILISHSTEKYFETCAELIAPLGYIVSIEEIYENLPMDLIRRKSVTFAWELMFTKHLFNTEIYSQGEILAKLSNLFENKELVSTVVAEITTGINATNLRAAHKMLESGKTIGKVVVSGEFDGK